MEQENKFAKRIWDALDLDISDRKGLKSNWGYQLDDDIFKEIKEKWMNIFISELNQSMVERDKELYLAMDKERIIPAVLPHHSPYISGVNEGISICQKFLTLKEN